LICQAVHCCSMAPVGFMSRHFALGGRGLHTCSDSIVDVWRKGRHEVPPTSYWCSHRSRQCFCGHAAANRMQEEVFSKVHVGREVPVSLRAPSTRCSTGGGIRMCHHSCMLCSLMTSCTTCTPGVLTMAFSYRRRPVTSTLMSLKAMQTTLWGLLCRGPVCSGSSMWCMPTATAGNGMPTSPRATSQSLTRCPM
jgi:hypothetical protein